MTRSSAVWDNSGSPGPKLAAGTPWRAKKRHVGPAELGSGREVEQTDEPAASAVRERSAAPPRPRRPPEGVPTTSSSARRGEHDVRLGLGRREAGRSRWFTTTRARSGTTLPATPPRPPTDGSAAWKAQPSTSGGVRLVRGQPGQDGGRRCTALRPFTVGRCGPGDRGSVAATRIGPLTAGLEPPRRWARAGGRGRRATRSGPLARAAAAGRCGESRSPRPRRRRRCTSTAGCRARCAARRTSTATSALHVRRARDPRARRRRRGGRVAVGRDGVEVAGEDDAVRPPGGCARPGCRPTRSRSSPGHGRAAGASQVADQWGLAEAERRRSPPARR